MSLKYEPPSKPCLRAAAPPAPARPLNQIAFFSSLGLHWSSPESDDLWFKSGGSKETDWSRSEGWWDVGTTPALGLGFTRGILKLRAVPMGTVLNLRTTTSQKCAAVPRPARI